MKRRGALIAFEGIDGSGKSTQRDLLASWLRERGIPVTMLVQPSDSKAGRILRTLAERGRRLSPSRELALFLRDRREQARLQILPEIHQGSVVLLDRHYLSSVAYQGAVGLDPSEILQACLRFSPVPDATFLVDLDPSEALRRITTSRIADAFEHIEYLRTVRKLYLEWGSRLADVHVLDGGEKAEVLAAQIRQVVAQLIHSKV